MKRKKKHSHKRHQIKIIKKTDNRLRQKGLITYKIFRNAVRSNLRVHHYILMKSNLPQLISSEGDTDAHF